MKKIKLNPYITLYIRISSKDFPGGTEARNPPANAGDKGSFDP